MLSAFYFIIGESCKFLFMWFYELVVGGVWVLGLAFMYALFSSLGVCLLREGFVVNYVIFVRYSLAMLYALSAYMRAGPPPMHTATFITSSISSSLAPALTAASVCHRMHGSHLTAIAIAKDINSFVLVSSTLVDSAS